MASLLPPPFVPVQLEPSKDSGKNIEGTSANPEETAGAEQMEKKAEESAAKKSKARTRDNEAKGKWWPCTTIETELRNLEAEGFLKPGSWRTLPGSLTLAPEAGEMVAYGLQSHNISPNSLLAISNHVTLCEGQLRVTPELSLFQYFFFVKKEKIPQTSELATCGTLTFKLRPAVFILPPTATNPHDTGPKACSIGRTFPTGEREVLPPSKMAPPRDSTGHNAASLESPQLTRAVSGCATDGRWLSGKDLTMSWFTKRIQPLQHRDRLMFQYTGRDDLMRASKDNLSADAIDKRIRLMIKIPRDLRIHMCKRTSMSTDPGSRKTSGSKLPKNTKKKAKPSPTSVPVTPEVEVPPKASSSAKPDPKDVINLDDLLEEPTAEFGKGDSGKGASLPAPPPEQPIFTSAEAPADDVEKKLFLTRATGTPQTHPHLFPNMRKLHEDLRTHVLEQKTEIEMMQNRDAENQMSIATLATRLKNYEDQLAKRPSIDELSAELEVLKAEHDSLQGFLKESTEKETKEKKEHEEKHAQAVAELNEKLRKSNVRIKTLVSKAKASEKEADDIDKLIFRKDFFAVPASSH
ncbi:hypothetical protein QYE76_069152 [Lolium multiflorum]|uniref:Transposase (putative) gypsy type domain-containing protein n=1 Tax=Lolium multiflorum TaxID=4521 RepID=A0AAD8WEM7_LOLMU|nr:hypothetical protein QYE76_069152 [Lolium multiflorum]